MTKQQLKWAIEDKQSEIYENKEEMDDLLNDVESARQTYETSRQELYDLKEKLDDLELDELNAEEEGDE